MGSKNKGGRETRKPKADKKPKGTVTSSIITPPAPGAKDSRAK